jgi:hypothetical protein
MQDKIITIRNEHNELIYIKRIEKQIYIHHTDCSDDYVSYENFINDYVVNCEELILIAMCIFRLVNNK